MSKPITLVVLAGQYSHEELKTMLGGECPFWFQTFDVVPQSRKLTVMEQLRSPKMLFAYLIWRLFGIFQVDQIGMRVIGNGKDGGIKGNTFLVNASVRADVPVHSSWLISVTD